MAQKSDNSNDDDETHKALIKSLETIKELLDRGDEKINALKGEHGQSPITDDKKMAKQTLTSDLEVPVLDDVVIPGQLNGEAMTSSNIVSDELDVDAPSIENDAKKLGDIDEQLANLQKNIEKNLHDALVKAVVQLESELKISLRKHVAAFRKRLIDKD